MLKKILKNQKGGALTLVVIMSFVVMAFAMSAIFIASTSNKQAFSEENKTQAFYIAKTGAESLVKHLEDLAGEGKDVRKELMELKDEGIGKGTYNDGEFTLEITGITKDKYEIKSTGKKNKAKDWIIAELNIGEVRGGGYNIGDGRIFVNSKEQMQIPTAPQLKGAGISIYSLGSKYDSNVPIHINAPNRINELFRSINNRSNSYRVKDLNEEEKSNYRLEITEPSDINSKINKDNPIKRDKLVKYKGTDKDKDFEEIKFIYDTNKNDILDYFSRGKLSENMTEKLEIKTGLESIAVIPIRNEADYESYIKGNDIYPPSPQYSKTTFNQIVDDMTEGKVLSNKRTVNVSSGENLLFKGGINLNGGGELTINTDGDTHIKVDGNIRLEDSNDIEKIYINGNGKVDFYITGDIQTHGHIIADRNVEVNFYMYNKDIQLQDKTKVENVNIYSPNSKVALYKVDYQGVIVGKKVDLNNQEATFRSLSSGLSNKDDSKSEGISVEWRR